MFKLANLKTWLFHTTQLVGVLVRLFLLCHLLRMAPLTKGETVLLSSFSYYRAYLENKYSSEVANFLLGWLSWLENYGHSVPMAFFWGANFLLGGSLGLTLYRWVYPQWHPSGWIRLVQFGGWLGVGSSFRWSWNELTGKHPPGVLLDLKLFKVAQVNFLQQQTLVVVNAYQHYVEKWGTPQEQQTLRGVQELTLSHLTSGYTLIEKSTFELTGLAQKLAETELQKLRSQKVPPTWGDWCYDHSGSALVVVGLVLVGYLGWTVWSNSQTLQTLLQEQQKLTTQVENLDRQSCQLGSKVENLSHLEAVINKGVDEVNQIKTSLEDTNNYLGPLSGSVFSVVARVNRLHKLLSQFFGAEQEPVPLPLPTKWEKKTE